MLLTNLLQSIIFGLNYNTFSLYAKIQQGGFSSLATDTAINTVLNGMLVIVGIIFLITLIFITVNCFQLFMLKTKNRNHQKSDGI